MTDEPAKDADSEPVPKLPRGRGMRFSGPELFRIAITVGTLVAVLVLAKPCGNAVGNFVMGFQGSGKGSAMPKPARVDLPGSAEPQMPGSADDYVELHAGMTDQQVKEAIDKARAKHRGSAGSAAAGSATLGSAASSRP